MVFLSSRRRDASSTGDWILHGVRVNESWDAGDNWNDADKNGDKRTMRQRCVTEHSDYIILPQDWAQNICCDYGAWTGQEAAFYVTQRYILYVGKMIIDDLVMSDDDITPKFHFVVLWTLSQNQYLLPFTKKLEL